jgi:hypothetical protein
MAISGNPKKIAQDISEGFLIISAPSLKRYNGSDLKTIMNNIAVVSRELRAQQIPLEDVMALKKKNMKVSRLNQAEMIIRAHCKKLRIPI